MKGYLLAAGVGSRLRPLTQVKPKPLVPFLNQPLVSYQHENLLAHAEHVRFNVSYLAPQLIDYVHSCDRSSHLRESEPLGSARTVWVERDYFDETTIVACADVLADYSIERLLTHHRRSGALVTIATAVVDDPRRFGVIVSDHEGRIREFQEKPDSPLSNTISTGIYVFEPEVFKHWDPRWVDLGGEAFVALVKRGLPLHTVPLECPWYDVGKLEDYMFLQLRRLEGRNLLHPHASIHPDALAQRCCIGAGATVGAGAKLTNCIVWPGAQVAAEAVISMAVVTPEFVLPMERRQRRIAVEDDRRVQPSLI